MPKHAFVVFLVSPALPPTLLKLAVAAACLQRIIAFPSGPLLRIS